MAPNKINIKDVFSDGEIDLSMSDLTEVPIKEIISLKKAYALDLSNNRITSLPPSFCSLTNIIKIDLSKNELTQLPENFGNLTKLKHLDLYQNKISHLPLSFCKLKDLKWLDLKDNPLVPTVAKVAGPCLDTKQCQKCAKDVVNFFVKLQEQVQKELDEINNKKQKQIEADNLKKQAEKATKKKEKTKAKNENKIEKVPQKQKQNSNAQKKNMPKNKKSSSSFFKSLFYLLFMIFLTLFILTSINLKSTQLVQVTIQEWYSKLTVALPQNMQPVCEKIGSSFYSIHQKTGIITMNIVNYIQEKDWNSYRILISNILNNVKVKIYDVYKNFAK